MSLRGNLKALVPRSILSLRENHREKKALYEASRPLHPRTCPICGYRGYFARFGRPIRLDAQCASCGSLERHRLFWLWLREDFGRLKEPVLHFAAEVPLERALRKIYPRYRTADLFADADLRLNIEQIDLPSGSHDAVVCHHVLEHVSDRRALAEIHRVLSSNGTLVVSVPLVEGLERTYENEVVSGPLERELHFGQFDHVRCYGRDFRQRLKDAGFTRIVEVTAEGQPSVEFGLLRGEKVFVCGKG